MNLFSRSKFIYYITVQYKLWTNCWSSCAGDSIHRSGIGVMCSLLKVRALTFWWMLVQNSNISKKAQDFLRINDRQIAIYFHQLRKQSM